MRNSIMTLLTTLVSVTITAPTFADHGEQLYKLIGSDSITNDHFGQAIAVSGNIAIVGAWGNDDNGLNSGSAYLINISNPSNPIELVKLLPSDGSQGDLFGWSVAIDGNTAVVGAFSDDDNFNNSGSAYVFDITDPKKPIEVVKLHASDSAQSDRFGISVAISGNIAIIGATLHADNGVNSGAAYLFNATTGEQLDKLLASDGSEHAQFGTSVVITSNLAIVGARFGNSNGSGSAYIFDISDPTKSFELAELLPSDGLGGDHFGASIAISGDLVIVGASHDTNAWAQTGSAYLFDISNPSKPSQVSKIIASDGFVQDYLGESVALSGNTAILGAYGEGVNNDAPGSAYFFDVTNPSLPVEVDKIISEDGEHEDEFGFSVAISGDTIIVGAHEDDDNGVETGAVYLFGTKGDPGDCPWDIDGSEIVDTGDLLALFAQWGTAGPADFDGSGAVDTADLLILFANWGPCP